MRTSLNLPPNHQGHIWFHKNRPPMPFAHWHDELELNLVLRGTAVYLLKSSRVLLEPNSLVWLLPDHEHILIDESADFEMWIIVFRPRLLTELLQGEFEMWGKTAVLSRRLAQPQLLRLHTLCQEVQQAQHEDVRFNLGLGFLLLSAWRIYEAATHPTLVEGIHPAIAQTAQQLLNHTAAHSPISHSLEHLSQQVGLSPSRLSRLFKQQTGVTLSHYRNLCRLRRFFENYKQNGHETLLEMALSAGFGSYAQFHRVFTQLMGTGPRDYFR